MYHPDGDPIGKPCKIYQQTLYDSVVLTEDTGVIQGLPIVGDQWKAKKKKNEQNELTNN